MARWTAVLLLILGATAAAEESSRLVQERFAEWGLTVKRQGARNTCSVFTMTAALEYAVSTSRGEGTRLSEEFLNWACNQVIGNKEADRGQFFSDLWKGFEEYGVCEEAEMPYGAKFDPSLSPTDEALAGAAEIRDLGLRLRWIRENDGKAGVTDGQLAEVKRILTQGIPVAAGSYHSLLFVGFEDDASQPGGGRFLLRDSGSGHEGEMSFAEAKTRLCDVFWIEAQPQEKK